MTRPTWGQYFLSIAFLAKSRSNCIKRKVGCVIVNPQNHIVSTGYNGTPHGLKNCINGGCDRCAIQYSNSKHYTNFKDKGHNLNLCICLHAEQNAFLHAQQANLENCTLYSTLRPCIECSKSIIQCKIKRVVYIEEYNETFLDITNKLFQQANIEIIKADMSIDDIIKWIK